jgi:hypothetical protein
MGAFPPRGSFLRRFYTGLHHPYDAQEFDYAFISINALRRRRGGFKPRKWVLDSGAFEAVRKRGHHSMSVWSYAAHIMFWKQFGELEAAVCQDMMCEPFMLAKTGLTVADHQRETIERYDDLLHLATGVYIMPVLQGYEPEEYADHARQYGSRLGFGAWVGVGSVCKRNGSPKKVLQVLRAIHAVRPDLRLHGFGLKITALRDPEVREELESSDSMAWSFAARREGRNGNDPAEAHAYTAKVWELIAA